jgi:hypothetical protein
LPIDATIARVTVVGMTTSPDDLARELRIFRIVAILALVVSAVSIVASVAFATRSAAPPASPTELTVQRLNIVEPDGTTRLVISDRARFPGTFTQRKEVARPDRNDAAGILFVNDEGTENGGLIEDGKLGSDGVVQAGLSLTFDRFRQDQVMQLVHEEDGDGASSGIVINDRPSYKQFSVDDALRLVQATDKLTPAQRDAEGEKHEAAGDFGHQRAYFGTTPAGDAKLVLLDVKGRPRIRLAVAASGAPSLEFLDDQGKVARTFGPATN